MGIFEHGVHGSNHRKNGSGRIGLQITRARKSSHRIHVTDRSMECFRPFDELGISRMVNCSDHELRPHFSGFQQNTFELIHRSVASISSQDLPVRRLLVADTKTDTKPVKISLNLVKQIILDFPMKSGILWVQSRRKTADSDTRLHL